MHCDGITRTLPQCIMRLYSVEAKAVVKVVKGAGCLTELRPEPERQYWQYFFIYFLENIPSHQLKCFTHPWNVYQSGKQLVDKVKVKRKEKKIHFCIWLDKRSATINGDQSDAEKIWETFPFHKEKTSMPTFVLFVEENVANLHGADSAASMLMLDSVYKLVSNILVWL